MDEISYELAKKLKDAGFPFAWTDAFGNDWTTGCTYHGTGAVIDIAKCICRVPTLSELMEACLFKLNPIDDTPIKMMVGKAATFVSTEEMEKQKTAIRGRTPEEAVANLYLALHLPK